MSCYIRKIPKASRSDYKKWVDMGYAGTWNQYCLAKLDAECKPFFVCGEFGDHCGDCLDIGNYLCDFPVGDDKTCDRKICSDHAHEVAPDVHYCNGHYVMWQDFKKSGGVAKELRNVIAFKSEK